MIPDVWIRLCEPFFHRRAKPQSTSIHCVHILIMILDFYWLIRFAHNTILCCLIFNFRFCACWSCCLDSFLSATQKCTDLEVLFRNAYCIKMSLVICRMECSFQSLISSCNHNICVRECVYACNGNLIKTCYCRRRCCCLFCFFSFQRLCLYMRYFIFSVLRFLFELLFMLSFDSSHI